MLDKKHIETIKNTKKISDVLGIVRTLASKAPEPKDMSWITINDETQDGNYCPDCAELVVNWLKNGGKQPNITTYWEPPLYASIDRDETYWNSESFYESDHSEWCSDCGCRLSVYILEGYGLDEIEHFEEYGLKNPNNWRCFLDVCESVKWFDEPREFRRDYEKKEAIDLHKRTLALAKKWIIAFKNGELRLPDDSFAFAILVYHFNGLYYASIGCQNKPFSFWLVDSPELAKLIKDNKISDFEVKAVTDFIRVSVVELNLIHHKNLTITQVKNGENNDSRNKKW